jgi:hypothetical protein
MEFGIKQIEFFLSGFAANSLVLRKPRNLCEYVCLTVRLGITGQALIFLPSVL